MKKAVWGIVWLAVAGLAMVSYLWFTPGRTPAIHWPNSIASLERIRIGGVDQCVLIRGNDTSLPVLLFLHGGPGMPAMYLAHAFQRELEKEFVVVQWDRRAAGKSYREDISTTLTTEQLVADTVELTNILRARFHQDRIYLVGHSWGTYLGMLVIARHPEFYHAYVGIGQLARSSPIAGIQDEYIRQTARRMGDQDAIKELEENGASVRETLVFKFGGEIHKAKSFMPLLLTGLAAPEYSLRDARNIPKGVSLYSRNFVYNSISGELMDVITKVEIPVYFFTGRYDYTDPFTLTEQYFSTIKAPEKHIVWFEESAHFPFYEEPAAFARQMQGVLTATQNN
ncbi:MAG TPA: alpha/beta hydrolase [Candidatus Eremiobacteraceae bacterium]|nr:alpha/beta hydrolase [Candidatus Eremiobacteraceae bacterium]